MEIFNFNTLPKTVDNIDGQLVIRQEDRKTGRQEDRKTGRQLWKEIVMNAGLETARWGIYGSLVFLGACQTVTRVDQKKVDGVTIDTPITTYTPDPLVAVPMPLVFKGIKGATEKALPKCLEGVNRANEFGYPNEHVSLCKDNSKIVQADKNACPSILVYTDKNGVLRCGSKPTDPQPGVIAPNRLPPPLGKGIAITDRGSTCFEEYVMIHPVTGETRCMSDPVNP